MMCKHCVHSIGREGQMLFCQIRMILIPRDGQCHRFMREPGSEG